MPKGTAGFMSSIAIPIVAYNIYAGGAMYRTVKPAKKAISGTMLTYHYGRASDTRVINVAKYQSRV